MSFSSGLSGGATQVGVAVEVAGGVGVALGVGISVGGTGGYVPVGEGVGAGVGVSCCPQAAARPKAANAIPRRKRRRVRRPSVSLRPCTRESLFPGVLSDAFIGAVDGLIGLFRYPRRARAKDSGYLFGIQLLFLQKGLC